MALRPFGRLRDLRAQEAAALRWLRLHRWLRHSKPSVMPPPKPPLRIFLPTPSTHQYSHLSAPLSFSYSSLEFVFLDNKLHQSCRILQNTTVLLVVFSLYGLLLRRFGAEKCATRGFWCCLYSSFHLHSGVCTCNLSQELK